MWSLLLLLLPAQSAGRPHWKGLCVGQGGQEERVIRSMSLLRTTGRHVVPFLLILLPAQSAGRPHRKGLCVGQGEQDERVLVENWPACGLFSSSSARSICWTPSAGKDHLSGKESKTKKSLLRAVVQMDEVCR